MLKILLILSILSITTQLYAASAIRIVDSDGDELDISTSGELQLAYDPDYRGINDTILSKGEYGLRIIESEIEELVIKDKDDRKQLNIDQERNNQ